MPFGDISRSLYLIISNLAAVRVCLLHMFFLGDLSHMLILLSCCLVCLQGEAVSLLFDAMISVPSFDLFHEKSEFSDNLI